MSIPLKHNIADIFKHFQSKGTVAYAQPYGSGHINDTYLVHTLEPKLPDYILQRVNHHIFKNVPLLMDNILRVTTHIQHKLATVGYEHPERRVLTVILSESGHPYYLDPDGHYWRMYLYVNNTKTYDIVETSDNAFEGGKAFGQFQQFLADLPGKPLFETIPHFHNILLRLERLEKAFLENTATRANEVLAEISWVRDQAPQMRQILDLGMAGKIPLRVTHNDTKFNNVLIDIHTGKGLCVVDLDTVMPGYVHYDFSDSIRTVTNMAAEDEKDLSKVRMNLEYFTAYTRGFLGQVKTALNQTEISQLAPSAPLLAYIIGVRFLTDHLEGDHYFKTHFAGHNLQRARAQFQLMRNIQQHQKQMQEVVDRVMQE